MLEIKNLSAKAKNLQILQQVSLNINVGEVHAIMGPNGSGKSTLLKVLSGYEEYEVTSGEVIFKKDFNDINLLELNPEARAREGVFLGFQYPVEIPGISNRSFLRASFNTICRHQGAEEMEEKEFEEFITQHLKQLKIPLSMLERSVNLGFSGGEKKRNEILQMAILKPSLALLDETDSGLDIDSMKIVANGINQLKADDNAFLLVTHYHRLLNYVTPDFVHIMYKGKIIESGGANLAVEVENKGYDWLIT